MSCAITPDLARSLSGLFLVRAAHSWMCESSRELARQEAVDDEVVLLSRVLRSENGPSVSREAVSGSAQS